MNVCGVLESKRTALSEDRIWFDKQSQALTIDWRNQCGTLLRIGTWETGLTFERWNDALGDWEQDESDSGLPVFSDPGVFINNGNPLYEFAKTIPAEILQAIKPIRWRQFVLLKMLWHCPQIISLLQTNPVLVWLLADTIVQNNISIPDGCMIAQRKRREILAFVGGISSESNVRVLSKIRFSRYIDDDIRDVSSFIRNNDLLLLFRRTKHIGGEQLFDMVKNTEYAKWYMLRPDDRPLYTNERFAFINGTFKQLFLDTVSLGRHIGIVDIYKHIYRNGTVHALEKLHDRWAEAFRKKDSEVFKASFYQKYGTELFPDPPIPGNELIEHVASIQELFEESQLMQHCVATYTEKIMSRESCIYRVLGPQRATLEIVYNGFGYTIGQFKLEKNGVPENGTVECVRGWFERGIEKINKIQ